MAEGGRKEEFSRSVLMGSEDGELSYRIQMGSQDCYEFLCQPCDVGDNHVEAKFYCNNCREYMCTMCNMYHKKVKLMNDHDVLDMNHMIRKPSVSMLRPGSAREIARATYVTGIKAGLTINSSALMSTNQLFVADDLTRKVVHVLVDTSYRSGRLLSELKLIDWPHQVTRISDTDAAVTIPKDKKIIIISTQTKAGVRKETKQNLSEVREINVHGQCLGIAYTGTSFIVSFRGGLVNILDMNGKVLHNISTDKNDKNIFTQPRYVTFSPTTGSIYVSDWGLMKDSRVVKLSMEGNVLASYKCGREEHPYDVTTDNQGMVYVAWAVTHGEHGCVEQLSTNLNKVRTIIPSLSPSPRALSFDKTTQQLYIGQWDGNMKVYTLS